MIAAAHGDGTNPFSSSTTHRCAYCNSASPLSGDGRGAIHNNVTTLPGSWGFQPLQQPPHYQQQQFQQLPQPPQQGNASPAYVAEQHAQGASSSSSQDQRRSEVKRRAPKKTPREEIYIPENTPVRVSVGDGQWYPAYWRENTRTVHVHPPGLKNWGPVTFVRPADVALNDKDGNPMYLAANRKQPAFITLIDTNSPLYVFDEATQSLQPMHQEAIRVQARRKSSKSAATNVQQEQPSSAQQHT